MTAVQAILAAQLVRSATGIGQYIDIALTDALLAWTVWETGAWFGDGEVAGPTGTRHRVSAPYQAYRTEDGYVTIGPATSGSGVAPPMRSARLAGSTTRGSQARRRGWSTSTSWRPRSRR